MGITLKEIAELAGVHKSTVDKVIHNRPGVSDAKRAEIRKLLEEYSYESNPLAKALNYQKKKMKVAILLPKVDAREFLKKGMELVRQDFNSFNVSLEYYEMDASDGSGQADTLRKLIREHVSGIVMLAIESEEVRAAMTDVDAAGIPLVTVQSDLSDAPRICYVGQDMKQSGHVAARMMTLLVPDGRRVGIISARNSQSTKERADAFSEYLDRLSTNLSAETPLEIEQNDDSAYQAVGQMLKEGPTPDALYITCGHVPAICKAVGEAYEKGKLSARPVILCHEKYPAILELMRKGTVEAVINGELVSQGRLAMRLLFEYLIYDRKPDTEILHMGNEVLLKEFLPE